MEPVMAALQFRRRAPGSYAADVGDRVYFITQVRDEWKLTVHCSRFTDYVRPRTERTKAVCVAVAREMERARRGGAR